MVRYLGGAGPRYRATLSAGVTPGRHVARAPLLTAPPSRMFEASSGPSRHAEIQTRRHCAAWRASEKHRVDRQRPGAAIQSQLRSPGPFAGPHAAAMAAAAPPAPSRRHDADAIGGRARTQRPDRRQSRPSPGRTRLDRDPDRPRAPAQQVSLSAAHRASVTAGSASARAQGRHPIPARHACAGHRPAAGAACAHETQSRRGAKEGHGRGADRQRPARAGSAEGPQPPGRGAAGQAQSSKTGKLKPPPTGAQARRTREPTRTSSGPHSTTLLISRTFSSSSMVATM